MHNVQTSCFISSRIVRGVPWLARFGCVLSLDEPTGPNSGLQMILVAPRQCQSSAPPGAEPKGLVLVLALPRRKSGVLESISSCQCQHALAERFRTPGRLCPIVAIEVRSVCAVESQTDIADVRISRIRRAGSAPTPALKITGTSFYYRGGGPGCACVRWLLRRSGALRKTASQAVPGKNQS